MRHKSPDQVLPFLADGPREVGAFVRDGVLFPKGLRQSAEQAASSDLAVSPISVEIENRSVKGATCLECASG